MATVSLLRSTPPSPLAFSPLSRAKLGNSSPSLSLRSSISTTQVISFVKAPGSLKRKRKCRGAVCYATTVPLSPHTLQWISAVSSAVLMLLRGTAIQKSFLAPLFALQAPVNVISWIKGEYGTWTAFLAVLVRLFYFLPGELELPFLTMLLVIVAPNQALNLRATQAGAIISLAISGYLAFQHFSRAGSLQRAFDQGSIIPTLAIICITIVSCLFLF